MIDKMVCNIEHSLIEVMKIINENAMGIAFVCDNKKLCGTVTDGDIRRALLNNVGLQEKVKSILSETYVYALQSETYEEMMKKISTKVKIIPIVDENHDVIDFFEYKQNLYFPVAVPNLNGNEFKYLTDAFLSSWISSSGEYIGRFESGFAEYSDCRYGVAVSNGTVALHLALVVLGIGEGDEVIVPDLTFAATINAVLHAHATPVIVDIDEENWCIDPKAIKRAITPKTKAIIPVHLYGQPCDMEAIMEIAREYDLRVIEDCAEAHGAMCNDKKVGSFGDVGCFSFFGNKVITTGEGGMCTTNNPVLDERMRMLRDHGMSKNKKYWHEAVGFNYRMTNLQAAIGLAQLERINEIHDNRCKYEVNYRNVLEPMGFEFQQNFVNRHRITWLVSILVNENVNRDDYMETLKNAGIDARPFFYPLSSMPIYTKYCQQNTPVSQRISKKGLNLPTYESLKSVDEITAILGMV